MQQPDQMMLARMAAAHAMSASSPDSSGLVPPSREAVIKAESFQKVKPLCIQLMGLSKLPVTPYSPHAAALSKLHSTVVQLPAEAFSVGLINYLLFPLTQILRTSPIHPAEMPPSFLETVFRYMAFVVAKWKTPAGGMDVTAWEQLWRFVVASTTPIGRKEGIINGKGKGREVGPQQEVDLERIKVLSSLLMPVGGINETFPTSAMRQGFSSPKSPLMPSLFQTISYTLAQIQPTTPHLELQLSSLRLLRHMLHLLDGQQNVLASVLPGLVSAVAKLFQAEGKSMKGDVAQEAAGAVGDALGLAVSDVVLRDLGVLKAKVTNLADLAGGEEGVPKTGSSHDGQSGLKDPFPPVTASWLDFTSAQLATAIAPTLAVLSYHQSHLARTAAVNLAGKLLGSSFDSLMSLRVTAVTTLLSLSQDDFDPVRHEARRHLRLALTSHPSLEDTLVSISSNSINSLPRAVTSQQDDKITHHTCLISAIAEIAAVQTEAGARRNAISDLLGPSGQVERWCWSLLDCLEFGRPIGWSSGNVAARAAQLGWGQTFGPSSRLLEDSYADVPGGAGPRDAGPGQAFPHTPFRYIESRHTSKSLTTMVQLLGKAGGETAIYAIEHFMQLAQSRDEARAARSPSALWLAEQLLSGIVEGQLEGSEGRVSRKVRKLAKSITRRLVELDEADEATYEDAQTKPDEQETTDALLPIERSQGINALSTLLDKPTWKDGYIAGESRRLGIEAQRILLTCRSLSLLSLCARTLSSSFRPLLMHSLYIVLAQLASPHDIVRSHAELALSHIAYHTGYASGRNMVLDNVDYVINVVSQRLTPARLAIHAPLVLIAMIRLVGSEIVPLVQDVVDEIFDALDDYHGYEVLCSSLLAVLVALIQSMSADILADGPSDAHRAKKQESNRVDRPPDPERDFARFQEWYDARKERRGQEVNDILEKAPHQAWVSLPAALRDDAVEAAGQDAAATTTDEPVDEDNNDNAEPDEVPLTRPQEVCKQILQKSTYFLSHSSPFLRSRVLALIAAAIPVLAMGDRDGDLLPVIDKAWGGIMTRLRDDDAASNGFTGTSTVKGQAYVVTEAAEVIASLAEHVGDYMSRRILDHAWPRFKELLERQRDADSSSALSRPRPVAIPHSTSDRGRKQKRSTGWNFGTQSQYSKSHRLHLAILRAVRAIMEQVPIEDAVVWDMLLSFRPFLDERAHEDLQALAMGVFRSAGKRDGDAVWVVLSATTGAGGGETWSWLKEEGLRVARNVDVLLAEI